MKKIIKWIKSFIHKYIVSDDPCEKINNMSKDDFIKLGKYVDEKDKNRRIYERNPDTGVIRSKRFGDYGNERIEKIIPPKKRRGRPKKKK